MDFVPDVPEIFFNLRHYNIATSSSGRRPALNTSCSLATPAALVNTEAPLPQSPSAWRRTAAQFEFPRALQLRQPHGRGQSGCRERHSGRSSKGGHSTEGSGCTVRDRGVDAEI